VSALVIDPSSHSTIYAGTYDFAVCTRVDASGVPVPIRFAVSAPASATTGIPVNFTVTALDQYGNTATGYSGTIHITSSDGAAVLPANTQLINGTRIFTATLNTVGSQTVIATDTATSTITGGSSDITVEVPHKALTIAFAGSGSGTVTSTSPT
jgi:hypothetical protein